MPFLSQMKIGVLDNHGVNFHTNTFSLHKTALSGSKLKQIKQFLTLKTKLIQHDRRIKHLPFEQQSSLIAEVSELLSKSDKQSQVTFLYGNEGQLIDMQSELIELGNHILEFGEWVPKQLRPIYFEVLHLVILRGELSLASLSLVHPSGDTQIPQKIFYRKIDVAADY